MWKSHAHVPWYCEDRGFRVVNNSTHNSSQGYVILQRFAAVAYTSNMAAYYCCILNDRCYPE